MTGTDDRKDGHEAGRNTPSFYAVLPANVRYCKELSSTAKLLYAEITGLLNKKGYCYASNDYFAKIFNVSKSTIAHTITDLVSKRFLNSVLIYGENKSVKERRLYAIADYQMDIAENCKDNILAENCKDNILAENCNTPYCKKLQYPHAKNCKEININLLNNNICDPQDEKNAHGCGKDAENSAEKEKGAKTFRKPTVDEIRAYCEERQNGIDAGRFFDYYESKGWTVGKSRMKDWKASVRTWERNARDYGNARERQAETADDRKYERCPACGKPALWWSNQRQRYVCDSCGRFFLYGERNGVV